MTTRDRLVAIVVVALAILAGCWFLLVAPQRSKAGSLQGQISTAQSQLQTAQVSVVSNKEARDAYNHDYATVASLGKAVPSDPEIASLLVQLQAAANKSKVDFREIDQGASAIGPAPTPPAPPTTDTTSTTPAASTTPTTTATTPAAPVDASATTTVAPGTSVGAGLTTIPFTLIFTGNYFQLANFIKAVQNFTTVNGKTVRAKGRLLVIGSVNLGASTKGFPNVKATITATAYEMPSPLSTGAAATGAAPVAGATPAASTTPAATPAPAATATLGGTP
jgi:Tfp pilus assembly protein PilO